MFYSNYSDIFDWVFTCFEEQYEFMESEGEYDMKEHRAKFEDETSFKEWLEEYCFADVCNKKLLSACVMTVLYSDTLEKIQTYLKDHLETMEKNMIEIIKKIEAAH